MLILGIDPGSHITGYGVILFEKNNSVYITSGHITIPSLSIDQRLSKIFEGIREIVDKYRPDEVAIEQVFVHQNPNSALKLGQARGVAIIAAAENASVFEYSAKQIKQAVVGYGSADKNQVQQMTKILLKLDKLPQADEADALAAAICHAFTCRTASRFRPR
ncbi:MAG: crossover junction endodeoxyribonuclease RuvC [Gammaproteobacteria bacterium]|nr:crossover junction endodeoxyribonuclease RuvC [Gammaproteobacteria bacterium]